MIEQENSILIVDDEPNVLAALARLLKPYHLTTVASGEEALLLVKDQQYDVVIADYRMPGINGIELLILIKHLQPDAIRIVLTGYPDLENIQQAINEAEVFRFINKPWNNFEIIHAVENGLHHKRILLENKILADKVREQQLLLDEKERFIKQLEAEEPGITQVDWEEDGSIALNPKDLE